LPPAIIVSVTVAASRYLTVTGSGVIVLVAGVGWMVVFVCLALRKRVVVSVIVSTSPRTSPKVHEVRQREVDIVVTTFFPDAKDRSAVKKIRKWICIMQEKERVTRVSKGKNVAPETKRLGRTIVDEKANYLLYQNWLIRLRYSSKPQVL
jgi:hypothetical protein